MRLLVMKPRWIIFPSSIIRSFFAVSDSLPWNEMMSSRGKKWVVHDVDITKQQSQSIGLTFKEVTGVTTSPTASWILLISGCTGHS